MSHTTRSLALAAQLGRRFPEASIMLLTDLAIIGKFKLPEQVDYVHLPGLTFEGDGSYRARNLNLKAKKTLRIRCKIAQSAAKTFKPQLVIVDRDPLTLPEEMRRNLAYIREVLPNTRIVWALPDVLGEPDDIVPAWKDGKIYKLLRHFVDEIWIFGCEGIFPLANAYRFPETLRRRTVYTGYLRLHRARKRETDEELAESSDSRPLVVLSAGSGVGGETLVDCYLRILEGLPSPPVRSVIITGPMMSRDAKKAFRERAKLIPDLIFHRFDKHVARYLRQADVVICNAGYNTLCDILTFDRKAILACSQKDSGEHRTRCRFFMNHPRLRILLDDAVNEHQLAATLWSLLEQPAIDMDSERPPLALNGVETIHDRIHALLTAKMTDNQTESP